MPRQSSMCSRRSRNKLGKTNCLCLSSHNFYTSDSQEDQRNRMLDSANNSLLFNQVWHPNLLQSLLNYPLNLPNNIHFLKQPTQQIYHTNLRSLDLHMWPLIRKHYLIKDFLRRLQIEHFVPSEHIILHFTKANLKPSVLGVKIETLIRSVSIFHS